MQTLEHRDRPRKAPAAEELRIPRVMSTQHPDNAFVPAFVRAGSVMKGDDEIAEAHHVFSELDCDEQMWDYEGKATDGDVVLKLLVGRPNFYKSRVLGRDVFVTLRIPNPAVETGMRKKVEEALHSITTAYDVATEFYGRPVVPIFEVILPFTTTHVELTRVYEYYRDCVAGHQSHRLRDGGLVRDWLGECRPTTIEVIPLVEDRETLGRVDRLLDGYLCERKRLGHEPRRLRVFLGRSDPALNYGMVSATLLNKAALLKLHEFEKTAGMPIYPIVGVGGAPFRGNFRPAFLESVLREYPSVQTFTVQSSFKYDGEPGTVAEAIARLRKSERTAPSEIDAIRAGEVIERFSACYRSRVEKLAPLINRVAAFIPARRERRLHNGLFGYSRKLEGGVGLPRAITFCAALYSIGVPPEILGMECLGVEDRRFLQEAYPTLEAQLAAACRYANPEVIDGVLGSETSSVAREFGSDPDPEHQGLAGLVFDRVSRGLDGHTRQLIEWAAERRGFIG